MRAIRKLSHSLAATGILLLLAVALTSVGASSRFSQSSPPKASAKTAVAQTMKTYTMYSGLWRTDGGFVSTIRVKNILVVAPMDVTPVLFMADGTPYPLASVHLAVSGVATININDALASAPPSVVGHLSQYGSAALIHTYSSPGHVSASMAVIDASRSLSFTFPFSEPMGAPMQQTLEGLWWKHDPDVSGWIALSNVSDAATQATVQLVGPANAPQPSRTIALSPHTTQMFHLEDFASNPSPLVKDAGGIRVQYTGQPGSVQVTAGLENDSEGYSANVPFWSHDMSSAPSSTITYAIGGLMLGKPDPMMMPGFPKDTTFSPYAALRNTTQKPLDVSLQVNYMMGMNSSAPVTKSLPAQHLAPFESRQLDLRGPLTAAGLKNFNGSINLSASFTGNAADLVLATGSVDQTGTYVFEVTPQGVSSARSRDSNYWGVAHGNDTMYSLWNPTDAPQDILATFYYGDGSGKYVLRVHLEPQASTMIDMAMLIMEMKPDGSGNIIPPSVQEGSAQFSSARGKGTNITLVVAGGLYNVADATCGTICISCCGGSSWDLVPATFNCLVDQTVSLDSLAVDCHGSTLYPNSWSSDTPSVATVDGSGNVSCVAPGSVTIYGQWVNAIVYTGQCCSAETPSCPTSSPSFGSNGTVTPNLQLTLGNQYSSIFVGTDPGLSSANTIFATVSPSGGTFTETSSNASDTFTTQGNGQWVINTTTQSTNSGDRTITVTYTVNNQKATQSLNVTARQFAYATNNSPSNTCTLGYGTQYLYTYTPYTHPDHAAVQAGIGVTNTVVAESFNPQPPAGVVQGSGALDANSQFTDRISWCSSSPLSSAPTVTQTLSVGGYQVRQNSLAFSSSGVTLTNQGPTQ